MEKQNIKREKLTEAKESKLEKIEKLQSEIKDIENKIMELDLSIIMTIAKRENVSLSELAILISADSTNKEKSKEELEYEEN